MERGGALRNRADVTGRQQHRRVRRPGHPRLPGHGLRRTHLPRDRGLHGHRDVQRGRRGPDQLPVGAAGAGGRRRHRLQFIAGGHPPGVPGAPPRRVRPGARRWGQRAAHARHDDHVLQRAHAGARRPVQDVRRSRRRLCARRRLRRHRRQTPRGCASRRRPDPRGHPRQRHQPGRRLGRADGAQRRGSATGDHRCAGPRRGRSRRRRLPGSPRHRDVAGRPDRSSGRGRGARRRAPHRPAAADRLGQDEHRPPRGGRRDRRGHQGHFVVGERDAAAASQLREALAAHPVGSAGGRGRHRSRAVGAQRPPPHRRGQLVRVRGHQRPRHPRRGAAHDGAANRHHGGRAGGRLPPAAAVRPHPGRPGNPRRALPQLAGRASRGHAGRRVPHGGHGARPPGASRGTGGRLEGRGARTPRRARRRSARSGPGARRVPRVAEDGVVVHRAGQPVPRHGPRVVRHRAGVRRHAATVCRRGRRCSRKAFARRDLRVQRRGTAPDVCRAARPVRGGDGPGPAVAVVGVGAGRGAGPQRRPVLGGVRGRRLRTGRRGTADGRARPPVRQPAHRRPDGRGVHGPGAGRSADRRVPHPVGGRLQRCEHRAVWTGRRSCAGDFGTGRYRGALRLARHQPCLPLRAARSDPRRIRVVRRAIRGQPAATDPDRQPDRGRAGAQCETRRDLLAAARTPAGRVRQERAHPRRDELQGAGRDRSATGADRRGPGRLAGPGHHPAGDRVPAPDHRGPPPDHRGPRRRLRAGSPARLRRAAPPGGKQAGSADLSVRAAPVLVLRRPQRHGRSR